MLSAVWGRLREPEHGSRGLQNRDLGLCWGGRGRPRSVARTTVNGWALGVGGAGSDFLIIAPAGKCTLHGDTHTPACKHTSNNGDRERACY